VSESGGVIQLTSLLEPLEIVSVLWSELQGGEDAATILGLYLAGMGDEGMAIRPGEGAESEQGGHPMALRFSEVTTEAGRLAAVSGAWICEASGRGFAATYLTTAERSADELQAALAGILADLACH
jgi:hypothetical protein